MFGIGCGVSRRILLTSPASWKVIAAVAKGGIIVVVS